MSAYSELLKDPRWQKRRLQILNSNNFTCQYCGDTETTLHVHHFRYSGNPWEASDEDLTTICEDCHWLEHRLQKSMFSNLEFILINQVIYENRLCSIYRNDHSQLRIKRLIKLLKQNING